MTKNCVKPTGRHRWTVVDESFIKVFLKYQQINLWKRAKSKLPLHEVSRKIFRLRWSLMQISSNSKQDIADGTIENLLKFLHQIRRSKRKLSFFTTREQKKSTVSSRIVIFIPVYRIFCALASSSILIDR